MFENLIDLDRWSNGQSSERFHPWYGDDLDPTPVPGVDGVAGVVAIVSLHSPSGGMTYEQCEPHGGNHYRSKAAIATPNQVRYA